MAERSFVYGVKFDGEITPCMVRDAIITCFYQAHHKVLENMYQVQDFPNADIENEVKLRHVKVLIKNMFREVNGDFESPTKKTLLDVLDRCAEYARIFRDEKTVVDHYNEILELIGHLK